MASLCDPVQQRRVRSAMRRGVALVCLSSWRLTPNPRGSSSSGHDSDTPSPPMTRYPSSTRVQMAEKCLLLAHPPTPPTPLPLLRPPPVAPSSDLSTTPPLHHAPRARLSGRVEPRGWLVFVSQPTVAALAAFIFSPPPTLPLSRSSPINSPPLSFYTQLRPYTHTTCLSPFSSRPLPLASTSSPLVCK